MAVHTLFHLLGRMAKKALSVGLSSARRARGFVMNRIFGDSTARAWVLGIAFFAALVFLFFLSMVPKQLDVVVGQRSPIDYEAPRGVENRYRTDFLRRKAAEAAYRDAVNDPSFYIIAPSAEATARQKLAALLEQIDWKREENSSKTPGSHAVKPEQLRRQVAEIQARLSDRVQVDIAEDVLRACLELDDVRYRRVVEAVERSYVGVITRERVTKDALLNPSVFTEPHLPTAGVDSGDMHLVRELVSGLVFINLTLDKDRVQGVQDAARRDVMPVYVSRGTSLLTRGKPVTPEDLTILEDLGVLNNGANRLFMFLSSAGLVLLVTGLIMLYLFRFQRAVLLDTRTLFLTGLVFLGIVASSVFIGFLPSAWAGYLIPLPMGAMLLAILVNTDIALVMTALLSLMCGVVVGYQLQPAVVLLAGSWAAVFSLTRIGQRSDIARAGLIASGVNLLAAVVLGVLSGGPTSVSIFLRVLLAAANGIGSSVLTIGFLPFFEQTFGVTSSIRLLELSNPNQPLLRRLLVEAPGTYHHSILVGNLAEAAAESIGANSLLARVAAYYHDIGKIRRPYFFVENQIGQENPHEKLAPTLSTLIITSHVRDGVELARENRLPQPVIELIEQHHGTDLVRYFYLRAAENERSERDRLREFDFRYAGPRPQSKEAAVLMLADSVEAAARSLGKPTPARLESLIERMIKERLDDGQFSECDITIKDLRLLQVAFSRVLSGLFHSRIEYPENVLKELERKRANDAAAH